MTYAEYIAAHLSKPFAWGSNDCITFAVGWLALRVGKDYLTPYGSWTTKREAYRTIDGAGGLLGLFNEHLHPVQPSFAQDGDLTLMGRTAMLFSGPYITAPGESGLVFLNRECATCAWRP